jgi:D-alanine-D-alanine ligase
VIFGGRSGEHEVSLASAASVLAAIDGTRYDVVPMGITRDGQWLVGGDPLRALAEAAGVPLALPPGGSHGAVAGPVVALPGPAAEAGQRQAARAAAQRERHPCRAAARRDALRGPAAVTKYGV